MSALKIFAGILAALMFVLSAASGLGFADGIVVTSGDIGSTSTRSDLMSSSVFDTSISSDISVSSDESKPEMNSIIDEETGLMFTLLDDGTYSVGCPQENRDKLTGELVVPSEYNGTKVTEIEYHGFAECPNITSIKISDGVTNISNGAFSGCLNLKEIFIPQSVENIFLNPCLVFCYSNKLENIYVDENNNRLCSIDGALFLKNDTSDRVSLLCYPAGKKGENYVVPDNVSKIFSNAFCECDNLKGITFSEELVEVEEYAVDHCNNLETINVPVCNVIISDFAISDCSSLKEIIVDKDNPNYCSVDGIVFLKDMTRLFKYPDAKTDEEYTIPDCVTSVFGIKNDFIKKVTVPEGIKVIEGDGRGYSFDGANLEKIILPNSLKELHCVGTKNKHAQICYNGTLSEWNSLILDSSHYYETYYSDFTVICLDGTIESKDDSGSETTSGNTSNSTSSNESVPITSNPITSAPASSGTSDPNTSKPTTDDNTSSGSGETSNPTSTDNTSSTSTPTSGDVSQGVTSGENVPKAEIKTPNGSLAEAVLTAAELERYKSGSDIGVALEVSAAEGSVSISDKQLVENTLSKLSYKLGRYLELQLFKTLENGNKTQVTQTNAPITVSFEIPEALRAVGREYVMIRIHNGEADVLKDYDDSANTITIRTDKFSVYVLAYSESSANVNNSQSGVNNPYTGSSSHTAIYLIIGIVSFTVFVALCLFTGKNGMTEEQKERKFAKLIAWGKGGGRIRSVVALAAIFVLLSFYYGVGMRTTEK